jgi:AcrR family transcriptional regulator
VTIGTRDRIVGVTADLVRRQGYAATGLKQIAAEAPAAFGSIYHFFPGGKDQLAGEVIRSAGRMYAELVASVLLGAPDAVTGVGRAFTQAAEDLRATDYADACPIATVALEVASTNEPLRQATAEVFESWLDAGATYFATAGVDHDRARELAAEFVMMLEGAFLLCRAMRTTEPLDIAGRAMEAVVRDALPASTRRRPPRR